MTKEKIASLLSPYANEMEDERLGVFLSLSIGRILLNQYNKTQKNDLIDNLSDDDLRHITDWLKAAIINNEKWLSNLDNDQRPKKLMKFSSIEQVIKEADKSMLVAAQKNRNIILEQGHEELVAELKDGYYIVKLLTPEALDRETGQMQHCIGQGGYDDNLKNSNFSYLSLRDPVGNAHATLEIENNEIIQLQGKQNKAVIRKYEHILVPFLEQQQYTVNKSSYRVKLSYLIDNDGKWHDTYNLPENFIVDDILEYLDHDTEEEINLPNNLTVKGRLRIENCNIKKLPDGLKTIEGLYLENTSISEIPEDLSPGEKLLLHNVPIKELPSNIKFNGDLHITKCNHFNKLPDGLNLNNLSLDRLPEFLELPKKLNIRTNLHLNHVPVEKIPNDLIVGNIINIDDTLISEIPDTVNINSSFSARNTNLSKIPKFKYIIKDDYCSINLESTKITELPEGLIVRGHFNIKNCQIHNLPANLTVHDEAVLSKTPITSIPEDAKFFDNIYLDGTDLIHFPSTIKRIDGNLELSNTDKLQSLPDNLYVKGYLSLINSDITELPKNLQVKSRLLLTDSFVFELNEGLDVGELYIDNTRIIELPEDIRVQKIIRMLEDQIEHFPESIQDNVALEIVNDYGAYDEITVGEYRRGYKKHLGFSG